MNPPPPFLLRGDDCEMAGVPVLDLRTNTGRQTPRAALPSSRTTRARGRSGGGRRGRTCLSGRPAADQDVEIESGGGVDGEGAGGVPHPDEGERGSAPSAPPRLSHSRRMPARGMRRGGRISVQIGADDSDGQKGQLVKSRRMVKEPSSEGTLRWIAAGAKWSNNGQMKQSGQKKVK